MDLREVWRKQQAFSYFYSRFWTMDEVEGAIFLGRQRDAYESPEGNFEPWALNTVEAAFKSVAEKKEELRKAPWEDRIFANLVARFRGLEDWEIRGMVASQYERRLYPEESALRDRETRADDKIICAQARAARDFVLKERVVVVPSANPFAPSAIS